MYNSIIQLEEARYLIGDYAATLKNNSNLQASTFSYNNKNFLVMPYTFRVLNKDLIVLIESSTQVYTQDAMLLFHILYQFEDYLVEVGDKVIEEYDN